VLPLVDGYTEIYTADYLSGNVVVTVVTPQGVPVAPPLYAVGGQPTGIAVADLNGDGLPDVVVTGGSSDVSVVLAQAARQFKTPVGYSLGPSSPGPQAVAIGDLNGDKKPDVIVANGGNPFSSGPGSVSVLLGNGDGTLKAPTSTTINQGAQNIVLGDFNGDGKLDAAVAAYGTPVGANGSDPGAVVVLLGKGDGTFQPPVTLTVSGLHPSWVATADLNGDGRLDLAVVMDTGVFGQPATLAVFLGQTNGTFAPARTFPLHSSIHARLAIGDLNGDGKPDIAVVDGTTLQADIMLGDGAGGFSEAAILPTTDFGAGPFAIMDLDGDGKLDMVFTECCGESEAFYLLGNGDGTFQPRQYFSSGSSTTALAVTRFSGSNGPDLVMAQQGGTWIPLLNAGSAPAPASAAPPSGSGTGGTFTFTFSDSGGYQSLKVVDVLINSALDGHNACYVAFVPSGASAGSLFLVDNAGDAGGPYQGLALPGSGTISNGQCTISGAGSSAAGSGNNLTLTLAITFSSSFTGNKVFYLSAGDTSSNNSGWQALGTWGVPATPSGTISVVSLTPARGAAASGTPQTFTAVLTDSKGAGDFGVVNLLVNNFIDGRQACYLAYAAATNSLLLVDDTGDAGGPFAGSMVLNGGTATIQNSQCSVNATGSSATQDGNTLTLTLNIAFQPLFAGNRIMWLAGRDAAGGNNTNWQAMGTTTVQ